MHQEFKMKHTRLQTMIFQTDNPETNLQKPFQVNLQIATAAIIQKDMASNCI
ncbi:unnamed protein product [Urochloa humidicola]